MADHGVILDFVKRLKDDPSVLRVLGNGTQEKPYVYVHDLVDAILLGFKKAVPEPYDVFNIGPSTATRVRSIAEITLEAMGLTGKAAIEYGEESIGWPGKIEITLRSPRPVTTSCGFWAYSSMKRTQRVQRMQRSWSSRM